jgi:hypothetical protein
MIEVQIHVRVHRGGMVDVPCITAAIEGLPSPDTGWHREIIGRDDGMTNTEECW